MRPRAARACKYIDRIPTTDHNSVTSGDFVGGLVYGEPRGCGDLRLGCVVRVGPGFTDEVGCDESPPKRDVPDRVR